MEFLLILSEDTGLVTSNEDRQRAVQRTGEYVMRLAGEGKLQAGSLLTPAAEARKIRTRGGERRVLDGPFVEGKEVIAGWLLVEADSVDDMIKIASDCPNAEFGSVEIRQTVHH
jgi:hypothetical protein